MNVLSGILLKLLLPAIVGALAFGLTQWTKAAWLRLDQQPAPVKQTVAAAWATVLALLAEALPFAPCADGSAVCDPPSLAFSAIVGYAISLSLHGWRKPARG